MGTQWGHARRVNSHLANKIRARDNHTCQQCGQPGHEVDHITPRAFGGTDNPNNLQTLCTTCHRKKTLTEQAQGRQRRHQRLRRPQPQHPGLI